MEGHLVRVSKAQLSLLTGNLVAARGDQAPAVISARRRREDLPENVLEAQIKHYLAWHGYTNIRQHVGTVTPYRVLQQLHWGQITLEQAARSIIYLGQKGMADWLALRPIVASGSRALDGPHPLAAFYWECKAPNKRPSDAQLAWMEKRRQVGLEATWFNQFAAADRPSPACEPRESHVFEVWFLGLGYFNPMRRET
jgi:hypothetical protein